jgi:uncharacterized membrane protein YeiB
MDWKDRYEMLNTQVASSSFLTFWVCMGTMLLWCAHGFSITQKKEKKVTQQLCFQLNKRKNLTYVSSTMTTTMQRQRQKQNNNNKKDLALKVRFAIIYTYGMSWRKYLWKHIKKACHLLRRSSFLNKQQRIPWGTLSTHHKWQVETKNYSFHNESQSLETLLINCKTISWKFIYLFIFYFFGPTRLPLTPQN